MNFTDIHRPCADDDVVTMKRAIQRALNVRLLAAWATAHAMPVRVVLQRTHVMPPQAGNTWPTEGVGLSEFLHNSDRGTLASDVLRIATSLENDAPSEMLRGIGSQVVAAFERVRVNMGQD